MTLLVQSFLKAKKLFLKLYWLFFFNLLTIRTKFELDNKHCKVFFRVKAQVPLALISNRLLIFCFPEAWDRSSSKNLAISHSKGAGAEQFLTIFVCANSQYWFFFPIKCGMRLILQHFLMFQMGILSKTSPYEITENVKMWSRKYPKRMQKYFYVEKNNCRRERKKVSL